MKLQFTGQIPHNVPDVGDNIQPQQIIEVTDELGKKLLNGFFVEVKPNSQSNNVNGVKTEYPNVKTSEVK